MRLLRFVSIFVLFLVVSLPVCAAQSLEIKSFAGEAGVQRYALPDDSVEMVIEALLPDDLVIGESQVKVCRDSLCTFPESCTPEESFGKDILNTCIYRESLSGETGIFPYAVRLSDDDGRVVRAASTELGIDRLAPEILVFEISSPDEEGIILFDVEAQDYGSLRGDISYCTGIERIDFYDEASGSVLLSKEYGYEVCEVSDVIEYVHKTQELSGRVTVCARAVDLFGQESIPVCSDFVFDKEPPEFVSLGFADSSGVPLSHIPGSGARVDVFVEIDDVSEIESVVADLSAISGRPADKSRKADYMKDNRFYWSGFDVTPATDCRVSVRAVDALGFSNQEDLSCAVNIDDEGPDVQEIRTSYESYAGEFVIAPGTKITAVIDEPGVGLNKNQMYLDLSEIGLGVLQADYCEKGSGSIWRCYWEDISPDVRDGDYQIRIAEDSADDLGNTLFKKAVLDVIVFSRVPRITAVSQYPVAPDFEDDVEFTLRVVDSKTEPSVFVDASAISEAVFPKEAACVSAGIDEWECYVTVDLLKQSYAKETVLFYTQAEKGAGQEVPFEVVVYQPEPAEGVDFYTVAGISKLPKKGFDKRLVYNIPAPVYLQPRLKQKAFDPDVSVVETSADCNAEGVSSVYLVPGDPENPYIVVKSSPALAGQDSPVKVDCTLSLRVRQGERLFRNLETETFSVEIPVYNNPLGTVGENAQAQMDALDEQIWDLQKRTKRWSDINDWMGTIVAIAQSIATMDYSLSYIGSALWLIAVVFYELKSIPYIGPVLKELSQVIWKGIACGVFFSIAHLDILDYFWNPGIVGTEIFSADIDVSAKKLVSTLIKTVSIVYSCQLCDFSSGLYAGIKDVVYGDTTMSVGGSPGEPTEIERFTVYDWDPYKSIHVSAGCLCVPGLVYNMRKEVQVNCIYRNCIEQNAKLGLPFDSCQQTYKEQNCLYVDGAAWRVAGGSGIAFTLNSLLTVVLEQLPLMIISRAWTSVCDPDCGYLGKEHKAEEFGGDCGKYGMAPVGGSGETAYPDECSENPENDWEVPLCGVWTSTLLLQETDFFGSNKFPWQRYTADLEGEDFCD